MSRRLLVTGGAGFIGSAFIRSSLQCAGLCDRLVNLDSLTYAGNLESIKQVEEDPRYCFVQGDICDQKRVAEICQREKIDTIVHFAAETHVDTSIAAPYLFYRSNVEGTISLLEVVRRYKNIHFHHISTDEVYGALPKEGQFSERSPYQPNSPYAASKASSDHFVRAYAHTFDLSVTLSHCTNNYGPYQHLEKFIPKMILGCIEKQPLPIYAQGLNVRDWIFVDDHVAAIWSILQRGTLGETYDVGGECEMRNIDVVHHIIDECVQVLGGSHDQYLSLLRFVPDRPGHDFRYAIDCTKIQKELGWRPAHSFTEGLHKTVLWYVHHLHKVLV